MPPWVEAVEEVRQRDLVHAAALVGDPAGDLIRLAVLLALPAAVKRHVHAAALGRELDGVVQEVGPELHEVVGVAVHDAGVCAHVHAYILGGPLWLEHYHGTPELLVHHHGLHVRQDLNVFYAREREDALREVGQLLGLLHADIVVGARAR